MTIQDSAVPEKLEGAALVDSLKKKIGTAALAGLLVPLGVAGSDTEAKAGVGEPPPPLPPTIQRSHVEGSSNLITGGPNDGKFLYEFTVFNTSILGYDEAFPVIVNWELPLFSLDGIVIDSSNPALNSIQSPELWTYEIIRPDGEIVESDPLFNNDVDGDGFSDVYNQDPGPFGEYVWDWTAAEDPVFQADPNVYGPDPNQFEDPNLILHWYAIPAEFGFPDAPIFPFGQLSDFRFIAEDSSTNAPYQASWFNLPQTIGDPPTPQGAAIGVPNNAQVSEPGMIALFATGLLGLLGLRRRRNSA